MALVFMDSMDHVSVAQAATKSVRLVNPFVSQTPRISGTGSSIRFNVDGEWESPKGVWGNATTVGFGCGLIVGSTNAQTDALFMIYADNGGIQMSIGVRPSGAINIARSTVAIVSSAPAEVLIPFDTWVYFEMKMTLGSGTSGSASVKINGQTVLTATATNTLGQAGFGASYLRLLAAGSNTYIDDLVMWDTTGSHNNDFMGDVKVYQLMPDANGDTNDFTASAGSNFQCVDETTPNDDTDYTQSSTVGHVDRYSYATLTEPGNIKGVMLNAYYRKTDAYVRTTKLQAYSNSNLSESSEKYLGDSYKTDFAIFERNPDGAVAWTDTTINAASFGVKIQS